MNEKPQTEARATIAAYMRGEITIDEATRRAEAWYANYLARQQPDPEQPKPTKD